MSESTERFEYDEGDVIKEKEEQGLHVAGEGKVTGTEEYEVTHRLVDADTGEAYYRVLYEDGLNIRECLKSAAMVHDLYREVETDTEQEDDDNQSEEQ